VVRLLHHTSTVANVTPHHANTNTIPQAMAFKYYNITKCNQQFQHAFV